jgi:hypothetical protein
MWVEKVQGVPAIQWAGANTTKTGRQAKKTGTSRCEINRETLDSKESAALVRSTTAHHVRMLQDSIKLCSRDESTMNDSLVVSAKEKGRHQSDERVQHLEKHCKPVVVWTPEKPSTAKKVQHMKASQLHTSRKCCTDTWTLRSKNESIMHYSMKSAAKGWSQARLKIQKIWWWWW